MKECNVILLLFVFSCMVCITTADIPDLIGNWTGPFVEYNSGQGFSEMNGGYFFLNITEQQDRIFVGYSSYTKSDGTQVIRELAGVISSDGTELSLVEQNNGYSSGKIIGPDEFEVVYLSDSDPIAVAIDQFIRIS